jgi:hypothetical protein
MLDDLLKELAELKEAAAILSDIYTQMDVYSGRFNNYHNSKDPGAISPDLLKKIRDYFKFDDSE